MKYLLASLFLFSSMAFGQTIIDYPDGSTYTLEENESVFISNRAVYSKKTYNTGAVYFTPVEANTKRDYVASSTDGMEIGSHEWCKAYVPWSEGYTFNMQAWQRFCDTDNDGQYGPGDAGWSEPS
jgi:hypothetical protein